MVCVRVYLNYWILKYFSLYVHGNELLCQRYQRYEMKRRRLAIIYMHNAVGDVLVCYNVFAVVRGENYVCVHDDFLWHPSSLNG